MRAWRQVVGATVVGLFAACAGCCITFTSVLIPQLQELEDGHPLKMDLEEASWLPTLYMAFASVSSAVSGVFAHHYGRRMTFLVAGVALLPAWITTAVATKKVELMASRAVMGTAVGFFYGSIGVYISETAHKSLRKTLGTFQATLLAAGMLTVYATGYLFTWRVVAWLCLVFPVAAVVGCYLLPETPYWLVEQNREEEAERSLQFYRGPDYDVAEELYEISLKHKEKHSRERRNSRAPKAFLSPSFWRPFSCIGVLYGLVQFNGIGSMVVYLQNVFRDSGMTVIDARLAPVFVGAARMTTALVSSVVLHRVSSKKPLFCACNLALAVALASVATFSFVKQKTGGIPSAFSMLEWVPVAGAVVAMVAHALGILTTLHILLAEIFPTEIRSMAVGVVNFVNGVLFVACVKSYPALLGLVGFHGTFALYSLVSVGTVAWGWYSIANNDGLSLVEVENLYRNVEIGIVAGEVGVARRSSRAAEDLEGDEDDGAAHENDELVAA